MSGFPQKPANTQSSIFNSNFYVSDGDYLTLADADQYYCKLNDYRLSKAATSISQSDGDSRYIQIGGALTQSEGDARYIQIGGALTQTQGDTRYQRLGQQFSFSSSTENCLSSGATSATNYPIILNHSLDNSNTVYQSNAFAFSRNNVVESAIALQRDISSSNQISFFINTSNVMEMRYRMSRSSFESQSLIVSESTRTLGGASVSGLLFNANSSPNSLRRIQSSTRFTMLGHVTSSVLVDAVSYDIPSTSLITFNVQADKLRLNTSTSTAMITGIGNSDHLDLVWADVRCLFALVARRPRLISFSQ